MKKNLLILSAALAIAAGIALAGCGKAYKTDAPDKGYFQVVVLSDVHLPGNILPQKEKAVATINSWPEVDLVAVTGDIVATGGDGEQYAFAQRFFANLKKPKAFIGGNHDYIYPDRVVVKTYDHRQGLWVDRLERKISPGQRGK
jgi:predicted MPP superfamily phosphohydrolase